MVGGSLRDKTRWYSQILFRLIIILKLVTLIILFNDFIKIRIYSCTYFRKSREKKLTLHNLWNYATFRSDWIQFFPTRTLCLWLSCFFGQLRWTGWTQLIWIKSRPAETKKSEKLRSFVQIFNKSEYKNCLVSTLRLKQKLVKCFCSFFGRYADKQFCFWIFPIFFSSAVFISTHRKITVLENRLFKNANEPFHDFSNFFSWKIK